MSDSPSDETPRGERIAKIIARSGLCSRREAEALIAAGRVELDGRTVAEPGTVVRPGQRVTVDGEALPALEPPRLFRFHKPAGILTAARDPEGRQTLYDILPKELPRLMPIGRLDLNSEGLLLLTNDGGLKRHLELPATGWLRRYRVRAYGEINDFEEQLANAGVILVKFWLAIDQQTQLERFKEREQIPFKRFKITEEDWRNRDKWDDYGDAVGDMVAEQTFGHVMDHRVHQTAPSDGA